MGYSVPGQKCRPFLGSPGKAGTGNAEKFEPRPPPPPLPTRIKETVTHGLILSSVINKLHSFAENFRFTKWRIIDFTKETFPRTIAGENTPRWDQSLTAPSDFLISLWFALHGVIYYVKHLWFCEAVVSRDYLCPPTALQWRLRIVNTFALVPHCAMRLA